MRFSLLAVVLLLLTACSVQPRFQSGDWNDQSEFINAYYMRWQGTPYRLGGTGDRGLDCSAFVQNLYAEVYGERLARTTEAQSTQGYRIPPGELQPGDLVFFKTGWRARHVGVYVGNNEFVHASATLGVTRSNLSNEYWRDSFWQARRIEL